MNSRFVPLRTEDQHLRLAPAPHWAFAAEQTIVPVSLAEADALAQDYVLVFSQEEQGPGLLVALLGAHGRNAYLNAQHQWAASAIPARLRLYPFALAQDPDSERFVVVRDADAPHFQGPEGAPVFDAQGQLAPMVQKVTVALFEQQRSEQQARELTGQLEAAGLLAAQRIDVRLKDGRTQGFEGFKSVLQERLDALDAPARAQLEQSGALKLLALHQQSLANFARLM